jgi:shikimate kinase
MTSFLPFSERNLILTGYIGPDQPLLGQRIAERLSMPYANLEVEIAERMGMPLDDIRAYYGETRLKTVEAEIVQEAALRRRSVIRVSGRTLVNGDNLARLRQTGPVFCLTIQLDAMLHRLHVNMGARYHDPHDRALALGELDREWAIKHSDGVQNLDATRMSNDDIVQTLVGLWRALTVRRV